MFYEISQKRHKYRQRAIQGLKIQCVMGQSGIHKEKISVYRKSVSSQKEHIHIWLSLFIGLENQQNTPIFLSTENIGVWDLFPQNLIFFYNFFYTLFSKRICHRCFFLTVIWKQGNNRNDLFIWILLSLLKQHWKSVYLHISPLIY